MPSRYGSIMGVRDYRLGHEVGRTQYGSWDTTPKQYNENEITITYWDMQGQPLDEAAFDGFLAWFVDELKKEKGENLYRHQEILIVGGQYMDSDVQYQAHDGVIDEQAPQELKDRYGVGASVKTMMIMLYTAIRCRNNTFTRESFSTGESMWDELGDLL